MNKAELVDALAEHFGGNRAEATRALNAVLQTIIFKTATEGRVTILGFGTFEKALRPPRTAEEPGTGKKIRIKALATPSFRAGAEFKAYVAGVKKVPRRRRKPPTRLTATARAAANLRHASRTGDPQAEGQEGARDSSFACPDHRPVPTSSTDLKPSNACPNIAAGSWPGSWWPKPPWSPQPGRGGAPAVCSRRAPPTCWPSQHSR